MAAVLLALSAAAVLYILIGYPLLLASSRREGPPVKKDAGFQPRVSIVLAVYNGERFLRAKLESLLGLKYPRDLVEILVVSDGSSDGTDAIAKSFAGQGVTLLRVPRGGKAAALNAAFERCTGEILFLTDVRQAIEPHALARLTANFADPSVGAVSGELRYLNPSRSGEQADVELYWRYELWARRRQAAIDSIFGATGCIYAVRRKLAQPIPADTLSDDVTIPVRAFLRGYRVVVEYEALAFDYPTAEGEFWRKLRTLAGLWQAFARYPALFGGADRMRLHFLSHKFARLVLPWALVAGAAATLALPASHFRLVLLAAGIAGATLALIDRLVPKAFPLKRITSPARSFLAMNAAALLSVVVFVVPPAWLWRSNWVKVHGGATE